MTLASYRASGVLLRAPNTPLLVACWFAVMKCGAVAVATMPLLRARELRAIIAKARPRVALCDARLADELGAATPDSSVTDTLYFQNAAFEQRLASKPAEFANVDTAADDVCIIAFTSGTTGEPKGTMHFHRDTLTICNAFAKPLLRNQPDDVFIGSPPLAFTFGLGGLVLFPMSNYSSTVLLENPAPPAMAEAIARHRPSILFTSPTAYRAFLGVDTSLLGSLKQCVAAGETLPLATYQSWLDKTGLQIIDGLGSTEMLHIFITAVGASIRPGATGKPLPGFEARVVDSNNQPVPPGQIGRLAVRGPTGCRYLDDPRQRDYVVDGWNLTGDSYLVDDDGYFWFQARADDMIISSGYNIAGPEVEDALLSHPAVAECAVVGAPDPERGSVVTAFVVLRDSEAPNDAQRAALQEHVKQTIAPYKYPRRVEFVDSLPRTETGKIQRFKLRESCAASHTG